MARTNRARTIRTNRMMSIANPTTVYEKVCFIGNKKTNKSTITRVLVQASDSIYDHMQNHDDYPATLGVEVHPYKGLYNIWDCAGNSKYRGLDEGYYYSCNRFIIFTRDEEYEGDLSFDEWRSKALNVSPNATIHHVHNAKLQDVRAILV